MNTNSKRLGIYITVMLLATAVATTLRTIATLNYLDYASGFFTQKSSIVAANVIIMLTIVGMLSYLFTATRIHLRASFSTGATYVPTGILGVATAFLGYKTLSYVLALNNYRLFSFIREDSLRGVMFEIFTPVGISTIIGILTAILAFASLAHHFFNAFVTESKDVTRAYFALTTILFFAFYAILIYIDGSISLNESTKTLRQTAFLLVATFFLYEARISMGREMWRIYTTTGLVAATLAAYTSIPAIITYFIRGELISSSGYKSIASIEEYLLLLAAFIFIFARLCLTARLGEEKECELVKAIASSASAREAEVRESYDRHNEIFAAKQLSIFDLYGEEDIPDAEDGSEGVCAAEEAHEEISEPTISDDAIYEAIFGKMPERPEPTEEAEEPEDDRDPEEIADDILSTLDSVISDNDENEVK